MMTMMAINVIMMMVVTMMLKPEPKDGHGEAKSGHRACGVRGSKEEVAARPDQKKSWFLLFYKKNKGAGAFDSAGQSKEGSVGFGTSQHPIVMKLLPDHLWH